MHCEAGFFGKSGLANHAARTISVLIIAGLAWHSLNWQEAGTVQAIKTNSHLGFDTFGLPTRKHGLDLLAAGMRRMLFTEAYSVGLYSIKKDGSKTSFMAKLMRKPEKSKELGAADLAPAIADASGRLMGPDSVLSLKFVRPTTTEHMVSWLTSKLTDAYATDKYKEVLARFKEILDQGLGGKGSLVPKDELSFLYYKDRITVRLNDKKIGTIRATSTVSSTKQTIPLKSSSASLQQEKTVPGVAGKPVRFPHIAKNFPWLHEWITTKIFHDTPFHDNYSNGIKAIQLLKQRLMDVYAGEASVAPELHQVLKDKFLTGRARQI